MLKYPEYAGQNEEWLSREAYRLCEEAGKGKVKPLGDLPERLTEIRFLRSFASPSLVS